jgi:hypothetical protein
METNSTAIIVIIVFIFIIVLIIVSAIIFSFLYKSIPCTSQNNPSGCRGGNEKPLCENINIPIGCTGYTDSYKQKLNMQCDLAMGEQIANNRSFGIESNTDWNQSCKWDPTNGISYKYGYTAWSDNQINKKGNDINGWVTCEDAIDCFNKIKLVQTSPNPKIPDNLMCNKQLCNDKMAEYIDGKGEFGPSVDNTLRQSACINCPVRGYTAHPPKYADISTKQWILCEDAKDCKEKILFK